MPTSCFQTCFDGKAFELIKDLLKWGGGNLGWFHKFGCRGFLAATVITLEAVFFYVFLVPGLEAAIDLGFGFLGTAVFLVAATLDCVAAFVTG